MLRDIKLAQILLEPSLKGLSEGVNRCKNKAEDIGKSFDKLQDFAQELHLIMVNEACEFWIVRLSN